MQIHIRHIDGEDVSLDDCANFSGSMGEALERTNLINEAYVLEISSPGIGNILNTDRDFSTFEGFPIEICFHNEKGSETHLDGLLSQRTDEHVHLNIKGRVKLISREKVIFVRLTNPCS